MKYLIFPLLCFLFVIQGFGQKSKTIAADEQDDELESIIGGLKFRNIGPAFASGRIADFAVNENNPKEYYVAVASGGIWKTTNAGNTYEPVFDDYGSYAIGCITMDPGNHNVVWAGTGENNHQRALGYGDGVYITRDGGKSWTNAGLKESRQIGGIAINPENTDIVYVAAEGSVWGPGGDRGLYKTTDGGNTWEKVLEISENTGVNNVILDPRDPDRIYATSEQRRRHVNTKIGGGPETAIYKSEDGGENWKKLTSGLPEQDMGGIGIAFAPSNPDIVYAIIEAALDSGGFFRSVDRGESWSKMSSHSSSGQYYNEIVVDPNDPNTIYSTETYTQVSHDAGRTWNQLGNNERHVDDHAMWIDPNDSKHFIIGGDGGVYESWDGGNHYHHKSNLPVTQFYRVTVDNTEPFYWVYGGTQDNNTMGGPSRSLNEKGIPNEEWIVTIGGDGFWTRVDPEDPNIVYCEYQYGNVYRYDKKSGEAIYIKPLPGKDELTYKWNWNTPLIISPHNHKRLYITANKVFRSDDRGNSWETISGDLTSGTDRNTWPVMGKYWSTDAVVKDVSTSLYGTIISFEESPVKEHLLYAGTDDGLIQVKESEEAEWRKIQQFPGVPEYTYVSDILASKYDENIVFASFDNRKRDDFKPYLLKSTDKGKTWKSITGNLPGNQTIHTIEQDYLQPDLLFVGTEFGVFFTVDGGIKWTALDAGLPTISVKDMVIKKDMDDLVLATFGRGFYILDDYSPLRQLQTVLENEQAFLFKPKDTYIYIEESARYGQGSTYYRADNPPFGVNFTWYLSEDIKTSAEIRREKEARLFEASQPIPDPGWKALRDEKLEEKPFILLTIYDSQDNVVRKLTAKPKKGIHRINWNLTYLSPEPFEDEDLTKGFNPFKKADDGYIVMPGKYKAELSKSVKGEVSVISERVEFEVVTLNNTTLPAESRAELTRFQKDLMELAEQIYGANNQNTLFHNKINRIKQVLLSDPDADLEMLMNAEKIENRIEEVDFALNGFEPKASYEEIPPAKFPVMYRLESVIESHIRSTSAPTKTQKDSYEILKEEITSVKDQLKSIREDIEILEYKMNQLNISWTPGRI